MTRLLRSAWGWIDDGQPALDSAPGPSGRMTIIFSFSVLTFIATALSAIVSRAAGDQLAFLLFAVAAGAFGASTSMLGGVGTLSLGHSRGGMAIEPPWFALALKMVVGSACAYLYYLLAKLGIFTGGPFPDLNNLTNDGAGLSRVGQSVTVADFTKLMAGCFLAGFTERWVAFGRPRSGGRS